MVSSVAKVPSPSFSGAGRVHARLAGLLGIAVLLATLQARHRKPRWFLKAAMMCCDDHKESAVPAK